MDKQPVFSVIMPVYGVERYLETAVQSVLAQTFADFELVLVDDCSPDRCPALCDELAQTDSRIRVIHKPQNEGLGFARNTGMQAARGEYVMFMDSDDTVRDNTLGTVFQALSEDTDILVFGVQRIHEDKNGQVFRVEDLPGVDGAAPVGEAFVKLTQAHIFPFAWNKIYRRSFLEQAGITFEATKLIEDFLFNIALFAKTTEIRMISDCLYGYRKPAHQTLVNTYSPQFYELAKRKYHLEDSFLTACDYRTEEALQTIRFSHIKHIVSVFLRNRSENAHLTGREQRRIIRDVLHEADTVSVLAAYKPSGLVQKALCLVLKRQWKTLCYLAVCAAGIVKGGRV